MFFFRSSTADKVLQADERLPVAELAEPLTRQDEMADLEAPPIKLPTPAPDAQSPPPTLAPPPTPVPTPTPPSPVNAPVHVVGSQRRAPPNLVGIRNRFASFRSPCLQHCPNVNSAISGQTLAIDIGIAKAGIVFASIVTGLVSGFVSGSVVAIVAYVTAF